MWHGFGNFQNGSVQVSFRFERRDLRFAAGGPLEAATLAGCFLSPADNHHFKLMDVRLSRKSEDREIFRTRSEGLGMSSASGQQSKEVMSCE